MRFLFLPNPSLTPHSFRLHSVSSRFSIKKQFLAEVCLVDQLFSVIIHAGMRLILGSWCVLPLVAGLFLALNYAAAQRGVSADSNPCVSKLNCSECIRTPSCAWCAQPVGYFCVSYSCPVVNWNFFSLRILILLKDPDYQDVTSKTNI